MSTCKTCKFIELDADGRSNLFGSACKRIGGLTPKSAEIWARNIHLMADDPVRVISNNNTIAYLEVKDPNKFGCLLHEEKTNV